MKCQSTIRFRTIRKFEKLSEKSFRKGDPPMWELTSFDWQIKNTQSDIFGHRSLPLLLCWAHSFSGVEVLLLTVHTNTSPSSVTTASPVSVRI